MVLALLYLIASVLLLFGVVMITVTVVYFLFSGNAPFVRTKKNVYKELMEILSLDDTSVLYEVGSGDASFLRYAINHTKGAKGVGIELHPTLAFYSKIKTFFLPITINRGNYKRCSFAQATHLYMYMLPSMLPHLYEKAKEECRPGTILLSLDFAIADVQPEMVIPLTHASQQRLSTVAYLYRL